MTPRQAFDLGWAAALEARERGNVDMHEEIREAALAEVPLPCPICAHLKVAPAYCDKCNGARKIWVRKSALPVDAGGGR